MFQIVMIIGWMVLLILLLYVWADVREIANVVKDSKRELLRSNFGGRTSGKTQVVWDEIRDSSMEKSRGKTRDEIRKESWNEANEVQEKKLADTEALKVEEEQVLQEVLAEFLG